MDAPGAMEIVAVAEVWSAHPVGFALLTAPPYQYVAYYDAKRRMTVASRRLDGGDWVKQVLPEQLGWDSHNNVTLALDGDGHLHVAGNMHVNPLVYFRSERPHDVTSLVRVSHMVGREEERVTYPRFLRGPRGELLFTYRDGSSGSGNEIYNVYDLRTRSWKRLLDVPLISGEGRMNAYVEGPLPGPDGYYHMAWVWRDTPDAATNHDVSYARSKDLIHWEKSDGTPYKLPITIDTAEIIDPVPPFGGAINNNVKIGFDSKGRVVVSYHKYDDNGITQLYNARREVDGWRIYQTGRWEYRWEFGGGGTIPFDIRLDPVRVVKLQAGAGSSGPAAGSGQAPALSLWGTPNPSPDSSPNPALKMAPDPALRKALDPRLRLTPDLALRHRADPALDWSFQSTKALPSRAPADARQRSEALPGWGEGSGKGVRLIQTYTHVSYGRVLMELDEETLQPIAVHEAPPPLPEELAVPESSFPGMEVQWANDLGESPQPSTWYMLRWESLKPNRDRPRTGPLPPPSMLRVIKVASGTGSGSP